MLNRAHVDRHAIPPNTSSEELGTAFGHIALGVPDAYAACNKIKAAGGNVTREAGPVKGGTAKSLKKGGAVSARRVVASVLSPIAEGTPPGLAPTGEGATGEAVDGATGDAHRPIGSAGASPLPSPERTEERSPERSPAEPSRLLGKSSKMNIVAVGIQ